MQAQLVAGNPQLDAELKNLRTQILAMEQQKGTAQAASTAALASAQEQQRETIKQIHDRHRSELFQSEKTLRAMKDQLAKGDPALDAELTQLRAQIQAMDQQRAIAQTQAKSQVQTQAAQVSSAEAMTAQVRRELAAAQQREQTAAAAEARLASTAKTTGELHRSRIEELHTTKNRERTVAV